MKRSSGYDRRPSFSGTLPANSQLITCSLTCFENWKLLELGGWEKSVKRVRLKVLPWPLFGECQVQWRYMTLKHAGGNEVIREAVCPSLRYREEGDVKAHGLRRFELCSMNQSCAQVDSRGDVAG